MPRPHEHVRQVRRQEGLVVRGDGPDRRRVGGGVRHAVINVKGEGVFVVRLRGGCAFGQTCARDRDTGPCAHLDRDGRCPAEPTEVEVAIDWASDVTEHVTTARPRRIGTSTKSRPRCTSSTTDGHRGADAGIQEPGAEPRKRVGCCGRGSTRSNATGRPPSVPPSRADRHGRPEREDPCLPLSGQHRRRSTPRYEIPDLEDRTRS